MNARLSPRIHAAASLAILLAFTVLFYLIIIAPGLSEREAFRERLASLQTQYQRFAAAARSIPDLESQVHTLVSRQGNRIGFLTDASAPLAAASLQKKIQSIVEGHGGSLISTQVVPTVDTGLFAPVTLQVQVRLNMEGLKQILYLIESDSLLLKVSELVIESRGGAVPAAMLHADQLEVRFQVTGYLYGTDST